MYELAYYLQWWFSLQSKHTYLITCQVRLGKILDVSFSLFDLVQLSLAGQSMCRMSKQLVGSTAHVQFMGGVMSNLSSYQQLVGLQLFLCLNLIGKYAWLVACPQVCFYTQTSKDIELLIIICWVHISFIKLRIYNARGHCRFFTS